MQYLLFSAFLLAPLSFSPCFAQTMSVQTNIQTIERFYAAFQNRDFATMQTCYADKARFNDPAFRNLNAEEVRAMWQMLITRGKDLTLTYQNITATDTEGTAEWVATYTFSQTKRKVVNHVKAHFVFENGEIVAHTDTFDFYKWSRQALGFTGFLLGKTAFLQKKVQAGASKSLADFMHK